MCIRPPKPRPKTRRAATANGSPNRKINPSEHTKTSETTSDFQAEKLRRLYFFCRATASTIASLAYYGVAR